MPVIRIIDGQPTDIHLFINGLPNTSMPAQNVVGQQAIIRIKSADRLAPNTGGSMSDEDRLRQFLRVEFLHLAANAPVADWPVDCTFSLVEADNVINITFTARANSIVDEYYCRISADDSNSYYNVLFRINVHQELREFHLGTSRLTLINSHNLQNGVRDIKKIGGGIMSGESGWC